MEYHKYKINNLNEISNAQPTNKVIGYKSIKMSSFENEDVM